MVPRDCVIGYDEMRLPSRDERKGCVTSPALVYRALAAPNARPHLSAPRLPKVPPLSSPTAV
ncbi:hypothetical protein KI387_019602, partial [Taxus chinensis]